MKNPHQFLIENKYILQAPFLVKKFCFHGTLMNQMNHNRRDNSLSHREVKKTQELFQRCLVHDIHQTHLRNQEIQDTASCRNRSEFFTSGCDLDVCFISNLQFLSDVLGGGLCCVQHIDEVLIIYQRSLER